jgi:hypothetical protein
MSGLKYTGDFFQIFSSWLPDDDYSVGGNYVYSTPESLDSLVINTPGIWDYPELKTLWEVTTPRYFWRLQVFSNPVLVHFPGVTLRPERQECQTGKDSG